MAISLARRADARSQKGREVQRITREERTDEADWPLSTFLDRSRSDKLPRASIRREIKLAEKCISSLLARRTDERRAK